MPKEYFNLKNISSLSSVKPGGKIHVIGVAGVAMAQLAVLLSEKGFNVSGSDKEFYEPMGSYLRSSSVKLCQGYAASNIPVDVDLVVIGNAVSYGHPEVAVVEGQELPYTCFPAALHEAVIKGHHSIVVTGTHGKSTTTAMIASVLLKCGEDPGYFVGGVAQDLPRSLAEGKGKFSVVEGDEYDSAFFAKVPKFSFYKADTAIINAIEFDHGDIYSDIEAIKKEFDTLVHNLNDECILICCTDFNEVKNLVIKWRADIKGKIITFGEAEGADYQIVSREQSGYVQKIKVLYNSNIIELALPLIGVYNARNALAAFIALKEQGLDSSKVLAALATFKSVKRRQEILHADEKVVVIEDFAHHPTSVAQTISAVAESFPGFEIWAAFEPRSATSRRKTFEDEYISALSKASKVFIKEVESRGAVDAGVDFMSVPRICEELSKKGIVAEAHHRGEEIFNQLTTDSDKKRVILIMSNGAFDELPNKLKAKFGMSKV